MSALLHSPVVIALCWTLLHSLWQGLLFAIVAAIIRLSTKNASAAVRYNSFILLLLVFFTASVATFIYEWTVLTVNKGISSGTPPGADRPDFIKLFANSGYRDFVVWISAHANWIVSVWLVVLLVKTAKISFTLGYTAYIRQHKAVKADIFWQHKVNRLKIQLRISKPVVLLESGLIRLPVVFGYLKPVIFVPLGLLAGLPVEQAEAILLHELAHIRRNDYLVNLLQNITEILFFFNPATVWLSSLIRAEREHCCDDIAIAQTGNRKQYVETLISFREKAWEYYPRRDAAFPGFSDSLPIRVRRIVTRQNQTLNRAEKSSLILCCFAGALLLFLGVGSRQIQIATTADFPMGKVVEEISNDLLKARVISDKNSLSFALTNTQLLVNGHKQPDALRKKFITKYMDASRYPIRPEHRKEPDFGIFFNAVTHVYGIGTRPPAWGT